MNSQEDLSVVYLPPNELRAYANNARTHSKAQIRKIADSIRTFGFTNPILIDASSTIVAGHGRVAAAKLLGFDQVPTIRLEALTPGQVRAYVLADNRLALDAGWNEEILKIEFQNLVLDNEIDISSTGFEVAEIDLILRVHGDSDPADEIPEEEPRATTAFGDLWQLGEHRIFCGDSRLETSFSTLMEDRRAGVVFTDPPYNVAIDGFVSGNGKIRHREFTMASGEMSSPEFTEFLMTSLARLANFSVDGSVHFVAMDWRHMSELLDAGLQVYGSLLNVCVWAKDNGGMGSFYRSQHEMIFVFKGGKGPHRNNIQLGKFGRNRTNVWRYPGANTMSRTGGEGDLLSLHPTVKPVALIADALLDCSARGEIVLDSFLGSGSTLLASERVGRICHAMEIDPKYVDTSIRRWQRYTGQEAIHVKTGESFNRRAAMGVCHE
jgi:DNA modification methylase